MLSIPMKYAEVKWCVVKCTSVQCSAVQSSAVQCTKQRTWSSAQCSALQCSAQKYIRSSNWQGRTTAATGTLAKTAGLGIAIGIKWLFCFVLVELMLQTHGEFFKLYYPIVHYQLVNQGAPILFKFYWTGLLIGWIYMLQCKTFCLPPPQWQS